MTREPGPEPRNLGGPGGTGPATALPTGFIHGMRAFRYRDFRIFFIGALASNSGNWLQNLAVPYVLFEITERSLWVGLAGFAQFIPSFFLGPVGGTLADRFDRRTVLLWTQFAMTLAAFALWAVWAVGWHDPWLVLGITAITGVLNGLTIPSWQAFVPLLVPREDLPSAITLNSTQFNAARAVGPALAGLLLATAGASWAFFINGLSFIGVLIALWMVRPPSTAQERSEHESVSEGFRSALGYITKRTGIVLGIVTSMLIAFFGNPITQFTVVFTEEVYNAGPRVLGLLAAAVGLGAVLLAPLLSAIDGVVPRSMLVRWGLPIYGLAVVGFGVSPNWPLGLVALLLVGAGFLAVIATTNTAIQMIVADEMRGRVMSVRVMGFTLAFPLGSLLQGWLADIFGPQQTVTGFGLVLFSVAVFLAAQPSLLAHFDRADDTPDRV